jgi:hypothetical protein
VLQLPVLTRATAENEEPTAGYMFKEIESILFMFIDFGLLGYASIFGVQDGGNRFLHSVATSLSLRLHGIIIHIFSDISISYNFYVCGIL